MKPTYIQRTAEKKLRHLESGSSTELEPKIMGVTVMTVMESILFKYLRKYIEYWHPWIAIVQCL